MRGANLREMSDFGWEVDTAKSKANHLSVNDQPKNVGLGGDGDEIWALRDVEEEFGVSLDYTNANDWSSVGDVYSALLLQLSADEAGQPNVWDRFAKAICRETGISPSSIQPESGLIAEDGMWVHVSEVSAFVWVASGALVAALLAWALL